MRQRNSTTANHSAYGMDVFLQRTVAISPSDTASGLQLHRRDHLLAELGEEEALVLVGQREGLT